MTFLATRINFFKVLAYCACVYTVVHTAQTTHIVVNLISRMTSFLTRLVASSHGLSFVFSGDCLMDRCDITPLIFHFRWRWRIKRNYHHTSKQQYIDNLGFIEFFQQLESRALWNFRNRIREWAYLTRLDYFFVYLTRLDYFNNRMVFDVENIDI